MKQTLDHLPELKKQELRRASEILLQTCAPDMIILFGSYARGDWQEELADDGHHYQYQSDFDLLLVTRTEALADRITRNDTLYKTLSHELATPVSVIAEDIDRVNLNLSRARYFYVDIVREGVLLYDSGALQLVEPKELPVAERRAMAEEDFSHWFAKSKSMLRSYMHCLIDQNHNDAAFMLHQAAERALAAALLVFTHYKPKTHDLARICERISAVEPEFLKVFPRITDEEKRLFELLRRAYVDARYQKDYAISRDDLEWLAQQVEHLQQLVERLCRKRIEGYV